jgi:hypothetical protein
MIEQFRNWNPKSKIKIKYKDNTGAISVWQADQIQLLNDIQRIVNFYSSQGIKLTNRQLYYQLVSEGIIPNADAVYKRICTFITDARYGGKIDWKMIEDRGRIPEKHAEWDNISDLVKSAVYSYRLPRWSNQEYYIELYCEKQAMESVLKPIADKYHIYFGYNKGYSSASTIYDIAQRLKEQIKNGKQCIVLYLGDHDPSGLDMIRDIKVRLKEFLTGGDDPVDPDFDVIQIALNMKQIKQYNPPPNPAKITDPRAKGYITNFGNMSWELDSLKPNVLIQLTEQGILQYLDVTKYNTWIQQEKKESEKLKDFSKTIR